MYGHGTIAMTKVVLEIDMIYTALSAPEISMNTSAGRVNARTVLEKGQVQYSSFIMCYHSWIYLIREQW